MSRLFLMLVMATASALFAANAFPLSIYAGKITGLERNSDTKYFIDLAFPISNDDRKPLDAVNGDNGVPAPLESGMIYVSVHISVSQGRSLSCFDYKAIAGGQDCRCLGVTLKSVGGYDPRRMKVTGPAEAVLLFQVPETAERLELVPASANFPLPGGTELVLIEKEPEATAAPAAEAPNDGGENGAAEAEPAPAE